MRAWLLAVLLLAPAASSVHGGAWTATGAAVGEGGVAVAEVAYSGGSTGTFRVRIGDPLGGWRVDASFPGGEHTTPGCCAVATLYHAYGVGTDFDLYGAQGLEAGGLAPAALLGHYEGFALYLALGTS